MCQSCSWVYDPADGFYDGEAGVEYERYTPWEALPETIVCPTCGSAKANFDKVAP
jgi:anaerobic nitric oxide reductase flavorubredoxin